MNRLSILTLLGLSSACSGNQDPLSTTHLATPIELSGIDSVFRLSTSLSDERGVSARNREAASLATGGLRVKLTANGEPWTTAEGTRIGATCGATLVSPSFAVTAAHCVDGSDTDESDIVMEMFRPTLALNEGFRTATVVSGSYPEYQHARLDEAQGYFTDRFSCQIVARCGDAFVPFACDTAVNAVGDTALLECEGRPGERYGYVDVGLTDDMSAEVFMPWKHEVYDTELSPATDMLGRYTEYPPSSGGTLADNYHYHATSSTGLETHQLLPLIPVPYASGTPNVKLSASDSAVTTDLLGCHGASGSGVMQRGENGLFELLGPARYGDTELSYYLCNHIPTLVGPEHASGVEGIGYTTLSSTQHVVTQLRSSITLDCPALPSGATALLTHLECPRQYLAAQPENAEFAAQLASAGSPSPLDPLGSWVIGVAEGAPVTFTGFEVTAGQPYRFGLEGAAVGGCTAGRCPDLVVSAEGRELLRTSEFDVDGATTALVADFTATTTGVIELGFDVAGGVLEVGAIGLVPADYTLRFDQAHERLGAVLVDVAEPGTAPSLMRFVGDGADGFEARLLSLERMVLPHLALHTGLELAVTFNASGGAALTCGLLGANLAPLSATDCSGGAVTLPAALEGETTRGFYIESSSTGNAALIDDVRLVASEALDGDADGVADAADDCPTGGTPTEVSLVAMSTALERGLCVPAPARVGIEPPDLSRVRGCDLEVLSAELSAVQGRYLDEGVALDPTAPTIELGLGTHTITWTLGVRGTTGTVAYEQSVAVVDSGTVDCCSDGLTLWEGGAADESHYASTAICALAGGGADVVRGSPYSDWLWGGRGSDFLSAELGDDVVVGGDGDDVLSGGVDGRATVYGGAGDDTIQLTHAAASLVYAGPGTDTVVGSSGDDTVYPGPGPSVIMAGGGSDLIILLDGCEATSGMVLDGGEGEDTLRSPLTVEELEARGVAVRDFEEVTIDRSRSHLAECFGSGL